MTEVTYPKRASAPLRELSSWWRLFGRRVAVREVEGLLAAAQDEIDSSLQAVAVGLSAHREACTRLDEARTELSAEKAAHGSTQNRLAGIISELNEIRGKVECTRGALQAEQASHERTAAALRESCLHLEAEQVDHGVTHDRLVSAVANLESARCEIEALRKTCEAERSLRKATAQRLEDTRQALATEMAGHEATLKRLDATSARLDLITRTLGARKVEHPKCMAFQEFLAEFVKFSNDENLYEREAEAILRLQAVGEELRLLGRVPLFREKSIIAVAGGFSSGKSSLITSFFDPGSRITLPIGVDPVTAIPTYIASGPTTSVIGFPSHGGTVEIPRELFAQMRHEFLASLGFDLRHILPFIMLQTIWRKPWENLCFIDTPGYNAPTMGGRTTAADDRTTAEALCQADAVLWVIGIDANGEISFDDLEYLQTYAGDLPLAVVINKADQRPPSQVRAILEQVRETLDDYGLEYCCISAYSSIEAREHEFLEQPLEEFLNTWNLQRSQRDERLCGQVIAVLNDYINAFDREIAHHTDRYNDLRSLKLDLDELGLFDEIEVPVPPISAKRGDLTERLRNELTSLSAPVNEERRIIIRDKAQERLHRLSKFFAVEIIESHRQEAMRLRDRVICLFGQDWESDEFVRSVSTASE